jgi:Uma2 family endonuclease
MTSILLSGFEPIELDLHDPEERLILTGVSWQQYSQLLVQFCDRLSHRLTYLTGTLEIMSPSRRHEVQKKNIARLLEAYLEEVEIDFWGLDSTTFRKEKEQVGKEPDECYCLQTEKEFPDLAIEVVLTSGGMDQLGVYQRLGIREVWLWQNEQLNVYQLQGETGYKQQSASALLPELDLELLARYIEANNPRLAVREFREQIRLRFLG